MWKVSATDHAMDSHSQTRVGHFESSVQMGKLMELRELVKGKEETVAESA